MGISYLNLRTEMRRRTGQRSTSSLPDAILDIAIKATLMQLASPKVHRHSELESRFTLTTVDGSAGGATADQANGVYALDADLWTIFSVHDTTANNIRKLRPPGVARMDEIEKTFGAPIYYIRWGRNIEFEPKPKAIHTIKIRGYLYPTFTVDGNGLLTGSSPLNNVYDEAVLLGTEYRLWMNALQDVKRGKAVKNQQSDVMETIMSPYDGELDDMEDILGVDLDGLAGGGGTYG